MTPAAFVSECSQRGIRLSLLPGVGSDGLPRVRYRARGELPDKVRQAILSHKAAIAAVLEDESGVWLLPDGSKLYRHREGDWRYVPPGADPAEHVDNFPKGYHLRREWLRGGKL